MRCEYACVCACMQDRSECGMSERIGIELKIKDFHPESPNAIGKRKGRQASTNTTTRGKS